MVVRSLWFAVPGIGQTGDSRAVDRGQSSRLWLRFDRKKTSASRLIADLSAQAAIRGLSVQEANLEDVIRHVYGESHPPHADARTYG
jgi:ABC-type uncharacterized transport system ATPase subunit